MFQKSALCKSIFPLGYFGLKVKADQEQEEQEQEQQRTNKKEKSVMEKKN